MRKPRGKPTGRSYTISCTDGEWDGDRGGRGAGGEAGFAVVRRVRVDGGPVA